MPTEDIEAGSLGKSIVIDSVTPAYTQGRDIIPERPEEMAQVTFTTSKGAMAGKTTWLPRDNVRLLLDEPGLSKRFKQERDYSDIERHNPYTGEREFDELREQVAREIATEIAKADPLCLYSAKKPSPSDVWAALCSLPREPRTHNRKTQRGAGCRSFRAEGRLHSGGRSLTPHGRQAEVRPGLVEQGARVSSRTSEACSVADDFGQRLRTVDPPIARSHTTRLVLTIEAPSHNVSGHRVDLFRGEDGGIVVEVPAIPGCITQGKDREEALVNAAEAIAVSIEPPGPEVVAVLEEG